MSAPMTDERRAEIREAARPGYADILAQLIKHGAHNDPKHGKVIVHGVTVVPAADLKAAVRVVWVGAHALLDEVKRLAAELANTKEERNDYAARFRAIDAQAAEYVERAERAETERDDVVAELEEERLTGDALRKDRDQIHDELTAARAALTEERARHGELVAEMQRERKAAEDARAEVERLRAERDIDLHALRVAAADLKRVRAERDTACAIVDRVEELRASSTTPRTVYAPRPIVDLPDLVRALDGTEADR